MNLDDLLRRRDLLCLALSGTAGIVIVLALALTFCALRPRAVAVLPGAAARDALRPGDVPEEAALAFARLHVYEFDNYTPGTAEVNSAALKRRIAVSAWAQASEGLDRRVRVIQEGRLSSQVVLAPGGAMERMPGERLSITLRGARRLFMADKLSSQDEVLYRLEIEPCVPTPGNPCGLAVVSQNVEEVQHEGRR